jgi:ketosteroid isomerase-like protein
MSRGVAERFVEALRTLEDERDVEPLVEVHTEDCEVGNVSVPGTFTGHEGLREFWTSYRNTFGKMRSTFRNVLAAEDKAALEWTTEGTSDGDEVSYDGVSILEIEGEKVKRFMAYFDTRRLSRQVAD